MMGKFSKSASVFTNDPKKEKVRIIIAGEVIPYVLLDPSHSIFLRGFLGEEIKKKITITENTKQPLIINEIKSNIEDKITYKLKPLEKNRKYELEVINTSDVTGRYSGNIEIYTNYKEIPKLKIFVGGNIKGEVSVFPRFISFGPVKTKGNMKKLPDKRTIIIKRDKGTEELIIKQAICNLSFITTNVKKINNKKYELIVELKRDEAGKEEFSGEIIVETNSKITPKLVVKVSGKII
jgi:hypothetical protein